MKSPPRPPQTATGFLAAMLIGLLIGGALYYAITASADNAVRLAKEQLAQAEQLHRDVAKWQDMARNAR